MGKKVGPNFEDENRIREFLEHTDYTLSQISDAIQVEESAIKIYVDSLASVEPDKEDEDDDDGE